MVLHVWNFSGLGVRVVWKPFREGNEAFRDGSVSGVRAIRRGEQARSDVKVLCPVAHKFNTSFSLLAPCSGSLPWNPLTMAISACLRGKQLRQRTHTSFSPPPKVFDQEVKLTLEDVAEVVLFLPQLPLFYPN